MSDDRGTPAEVARLTELLAAPDIMAELVRRARRRQMMAEEVLLAMQYSRSSARGPIDLPPIGKVWLP